MENIAKRLDQIVAHRSRVAAKRSDLGRLLGKLENDLRALVKELGDPADPFTNTQLITIELATRQDKEHAITFCVARDWVLEFGIHNRDVPLIVNGERQRVAFGFYTFTNARDIPGQFDDDFLHGLVGIGEEGDAIVFYERA